VLVCARQIVTSSGSTRSRVCVTRLNYRAACRVLRGQQKKSAVCWILQDSEQKAQTESWILQVSQDAASYRYVSWILQGRYHRRYSWILQVAGHHTYCQLDSPGQAARQLSELDYPVDRGAALACGLV
jgi:hypothetical protein